MAAGSLAQARPEVDLSSVEEVLLANQEDDDLFKRILADRKVLIIDNDLRDIFAITSILERYKVTVLYAEIGLNGVNLLRKHQDIDCVLVDVSLNHSDGYETMLLIRKISELKNLPIIALTSKTIKVDREKCLRAGASNFLLKPVNQEKLIFAVAMALRN
jgi:CheY-like chemotaxis protein